MRISLRRHLWICVYVPQMACMVYVLSKDQAPLSYISLPLFPFIRGDVLPATFSPPHLLFFSTLLCLLTSSSSLPPLLSSSHLSVHSPPISVLASLVSSCPAHVTMRLSSVVFHRPSFGCARACVRVCACVCVCVCVCMGVCVDIIYLSYR